MFPNDPDLSNASDSTTLIWDEAGVPRSRLYGDVYFSAVDGLAESEAVFLQGCNLPAAWTGRDRFVVAELGFGTGLNILALLRLWKANRPVGGQLHIFSVEAHPLSENQARQALSAWPQIGDLADLILAQWPGQARGFHRINLTELGVTIDVAIMEAAQALTAWTGKADAWFLDGFSPATNPQMWRPEVLQRVATHSAPGAIAATFTVAGAVRRGLAEQGFEVAKRPGFGRKRERLEAIWPGTGSDLPAHPRKIAIIGAGIAGAALSRAFKQQGSDVQVFDQIGPGAGASGNRAALVTPRLDLGDGASAHLYAQAFRHAVATYEREVPRAVLGRGVMQLEANLGDPPRFDRLAHLDLFEPGDLTRLSDAMVKDHLLEAPRVGGLWLRPALSLAPAPVLADWLGPVVSAQIDTITPHPEGWALIDPHGGVITVADCVCIAAGAGTSAFSVDLPTQIVRGQITMAASEQSFCAVTGGAYALALADGVLFGATHDRDQTGTDVRAEDNQRNLSQLQKIMPNLAETLANCTLTARASLRAAGTDHLPLAGAVPGMAGVYVLGGLGGRGFTLSPLLAEHVAALALSCPSPLPQAIASAIDPARFERRRLRRRGNG